MSAESVSQSSVAFGSAEPRNRPRTFAQQTLIDTFSRTGARLGLIWLGIVFLCGAFAPFLASSFPILMKRDGVWSSPMIQNLSSADVLVVILTLLAIGMKLLRFRLGQILAAVVWVLALLLYPACRPTWDYVRDMAWNEIPQFNPLYAALILGQLAVLTLVPMFSSLSPRAKTVLGFLGVALVGVLLAFPIHPLEARAYTYREDLKIGFIEKAYFTLIPFSPDDRLRDFETPQQNLPPGRQHLFGTTANGEDVLSGMIHACRIAVSVGFISTGIAVVIGCIIGGLMGYFAGTVDIIGMRLIEIFEAIPTLFLLITFVAFYGRDLYIMMAIIGATSWPSNARFIRAEFLRLRRQDFVQAAIAAGLPLRSILFRHMLPNGIAPVLVTASFGIAAAILAEATLSFLGLGLIDEPSWGRMLDQARGVGADFFWWLAIFPGAAIFLTVFAYNLIGEAFRDALDPKLRKRD